MECRNIDDRSVWDAFLDEIHPHTFLQAWSWGAFHEQQRESIFRLGLYDHETLVGTALILLIRARRGSFLFCPHGPIMAAGTDAHTILACLTNYLKSLAREHNCAFLRVSPLILLSTGQERMFRELGFRSAPIHMHPELAWMLDVTSSEEELQKQMRKTTRHALRKAEQEGVRVTISEDSSALESFWQVYQATVDRQNFTPFSRAYLWNEFETFQKDHQALVATGTYQNEVISSAIVIFSTDTAFYHHGASDNSRHPKIPAAHLLQWRIIQEAKRRGCNFYNFWGVSPEDQPRHPWAGLSMFKRGFGGFAEEYVHAQDLILSPKYWLTFGIEALRKWKRGL